MRGLGKTKFIIDALSLYDSVEVYRFAGGICLMNSDGLRINIYTPGPEQSKKYFDIAKKLIGDKCMSSDIEIEKEIQEKGLTAPRVTPDLLEEVIVNEEYKVFEKTQLTVCVLTLKNGFTVTGESACASPENFDEELGRKIARRNAKDKIWALEGYLLKQKLYERQSTFKNLEKSS